MRTLFPSRSATPPFSRFADGRGYVGTLLYFLALPVTAPFAFLQRTLGWGLTTLPAFLEELEILGLKGKRFGPCEYADALASYLGVRISFEILDDARDPRLARGFVRAGRTACLWYDKQADTLRIFVPGSLPPVEMTAALYHELAHLAAGHSLDSYGPYNKGSQRKKALPKRLARRPPTTSSALMEKEADLREDYAITAGALGSLCLEDEALGQL